MNHSWGFQVHREKIKQKTFSLKEKRYDQKFWHQWTDGFAVWMLYAEFSRVLFFLCPKMQFWGILDKQSDWLALGKQNVCTNISVWSHWVAKLADKSEHSENRRACWKKKLSGETKIGNTSANIDGFGWGSYACTHSELVQVRLKTTRLITNRLNKDISIQSMLRDWPPNNWDNIRTQWPNLVRLPILLSNRDFNLPSSILSSCLKS